MRIKLLLHLGALVVFAISATAQDCYESSIVSPSPFMGNNEEIFRLADGTLWEVKYEYEYLYEYYPSVIICPDQGRLIIGGKSLDVELVSAAANSRKPDSKPTGEWEVFEETNLRGVISGIVKQGHIFKTTSGSIYEVTGITLQVVVAVQPDVTVLRNGDTYKLIVEGFDEPLTCRCLNCTKSVTAPSSTTSQLDKATIKAVQSGLTILGFDAGPIDGTLGPQTRSGVEKFRDSSNLTASDSLDATMLRSIAVALAKKHSDESEALTVAAYLLQASENWSPSRSGKKSLATAAQKQGTEKAAPQATVYITKIDDDSDDVLILANGAIVEISSGYLGFVGLRRDAVLFRDGRTWKIWIEGKRVFRCDLLKAPTVPSSGTHEKVYISEVMGGGSILKTLDGSIYEVDSLDTIHTMLWLGNSEALLINGVRLINLDEGGEIIGVTKLK